MKKDLTSGSIFGALLRLAGPIIAANILQTAYNITDTFWLGRLGADAVASVSLSFPVIFLLISMGAGLAIAGTVLVAQYKGSKNQRKVDHVAGQSVLMMFFVSIVLSVVGYFVSPYIIGLMGAEQSIVPDAISYMRIIFLGLIFLFAYFVFQSLLRGVGDVKTPLYVVLGTVLLNLLLDPLFIFGLGFGVSGAAIATLFTQGLAGVIGMAILFSGKYNIHLKLNELKPDWKVIKKVFLLGFPASMEHSTRALGITAMTFVVATFGKEVIAAYGIGSRIFSLIIIPGIGLSMATSTLVGQNMGAKKIKRAEKSSLMSAGIGFGVLSLVGVVFFFLARPMSAFFVPGDERVIALSAEFIMIMALSFGFQGVQMVFTGTFRGSGNTIMAMTIAIISLLVLRFPLAYVLSKHTSLGYLGIWWSFPISIFITTIVAVIWYCTGSWKKKKLIEDEVSSETYIESRVE